jgi:hypothetical protein
VEQLFPEQAWLPVQSLSPQQLPTTQVPLHSFDPDLQPAAHVLF